MYILYNILQFFCYTNLFLGCSNHSWRNWIICFYIQLLLPHCIWGAQEATHSIWGSQVWFFMVFPHRGDAFPSLLCWTNLSAVLVRIAIFLLLPPRPPKHCYQRPSYQCKLVGKLCSEPIFKCLLHVSLRL